jgi:TatD DNase family protein
MDLIDTHCHLDISAFAPRQARLLARAREVGVQQLVLPGVDRAGWWRLFSLSRSEAGIHAAPGLHPIYLSCHQPGDLEELAVAIRREKVVAIGEIGLDYYVPGIDRQEQQRLFEEQLRLAAAAHLPVLLHVRKAHDQVLATLRRKRFTHGGIVHAFNGSRQQAEQFEALGFGLGVCGTITYPRARKIRAIIANFSAAALVLETDAPDIPTAAHRGEENLPEYLPEILAALAELRHTEPERLAELTTANASRILGLPPCPNRSGPPDAPL